MASEQAPIHTFKVKLATEHKSWVEIDLLDDAKLSVFSVTAQQVRDVSICYDVPGYLYEEIGEASTTHPCAGSACVIFTDPHGQVCSNDFIVYYDYNPGKNKHHAEGKLHWNVEIRRMRNGQEIALRDKSFDGHQIKDSSDITLTAEFKGITHNQIIQRESIKL
jgi:hypothetical protein